MYGAGPGGGAGTGTGLTAGGVLAATGFNSGLIAFMAVALLLGGLLLLRSFRHRELEITQN